MGKRAIGSRGGEASFLQVRERRLNQFPTEMKTPISPSISSGTQRPRWSRGAGTMPRGVKLLHGGTF